MNGTVAMGDENEYKQELTRLFQKIEALEERIVKRIFDDVLKRLPEKEGFSVSEFCKLTGFDRDTVIRYCNEGYLEATQIRKNGSWMIKSSELTRLRNEALANRRNKPSSTAKRDKIILRNKD